MRVRFGIQSSSEFDQVLPRDDDIGIHERDRKRLGRITAGVEGGDLRRRGDLDHPDALAFGPRSLGGAVGAAVRHDDHIDVAFGSGQQRAKRPADHALLIVGGHDHRRPRHAGCRILRSTEASSTLGFSHVERPSVMAHAATAYSIDSTRSVCMNAKAS